MTLVAKLTGEVLIRAVAQERLKGMSRLIREGSASRHREVPVTLAKTD